jgi:SAM-dependent methyltransferase
VDTTPLQQRSERLARTAFLGGPPTDFERVGRLSFEVLFREGLQPSSKVLDVGCGALRLGYWLMRFQNPRCYFGIEVQQDMLKLGLEQLVEPEVVSRAEPSFSHNDDFDFSVFGEQFEFVYARSIWTHASKSQIRSMLASFAASSAPGGVFLTSYAPASPWAKIPRRWPRLHRLVAMLPLEALSPALARLPALGLSDEYEGEEWIGLSHESHVAGTASYSLRWVAAEARRHGLTTQLVPYRIVNHQYWLRITRTASA